MSNKGIPLTAINGGMNRLRVKGAARRDTLYQLTNGYVTAGSTIKARPGTIRNVDLSATTGAGATKGLVAFNGSRHIFSDHVVPVPAGYTLHVLSHPATQAVANSVDVTVNPIGHSGDLLQYGFYTGSFGTATPTALGALTLAGVGSATILNNGPFVIMAGTLAQNAFTSIVDGGVTYNTASAAIFSANGFYPGKTYWGWTGPLWPTSGSRVVTLTGGNIVAYGPIALKEIHFAAPFMGFLYVVAEFTSDGGSGLGTVFHYWLQTSGTWKASTDYQVGQIVSPTAPNGMSFRAERVSAPSPKWAASTLKAVSDKVEPSTPNGFLYTATAVDGANPITGTTEPTWPVVAGAVVYEESEKTDTGEVATPAPQPSATTPSPGTGGKYTNPYRGLLGV